MQLGRGGLHPTCIIGAASQLVMDIQDEELGDSIYGSLEGYIGSTMFEVGLHTCQKRMFSIMVIKFQACSASRSSSFRSWVRGKRAETRSA
jgi:hypothetical protein